ncbi:hypothetical protein HPB49_014382 [Dermacentor silvarum]|uniref:Uncharacterized protein n=1 Tax=Dermacentor silvarum TaxID=543639 RepID=A0ACB8C446_DERSI|nr:hypothetical protein HPB49_014382 [Dermacentor silvarum]
MWRRYKSSNSWKWLEVKPNEICEHNSKINKLIQRCKEQDTANQASKPQGMPNITPPLTEERIKEIVTMEVRKQIQEAMTTFAKEITQQLQQHITTQLVSTYATLQDLSNFMSYAKQNHGETHEHKKPRKPNEICEHNSKINKLIQRCKEQDTANQASKPQGMPNITPPLTEERIKEIVTMEVRKQIQEAMTTFAKEITQQLQQHITTQLASTYATLQDLSNFMSYAKQNHVTKATVENLLNNTDTARKKARKDLHNAARAESMTWGDNNDIDQDGE